MHEDLIDRLQMQVSELCSNCCYRHKEYGCLAPMEEKHYCHAGAILEAIDVIGRKGKWELNAPDDFIVYCSECMMPQDSPCNFCPSCGADMR